MQDNKAGYDGNNPVAELGFQGGGSEILVLLTICKKPGLPGQFRQSLKAGKGGTNLLKKVFCLLLVLFGFLRLAH